MALKIKSSGLGNNKGWKNEPIRHGLARKGVKTGTKLTPIGRVFEVARLVKRGKDIEKSIKSKKDLVEDKRRKVIDVEGKVVEEEAKPEVKVGRPKKVFTKKEIEAIERLPAKRERAIRKAGQIVREDIKKAGKVVKKGVSKFVTFAEGLQPEKPRVVHKADFMGKRGVTIRKIDLDVQAKRQREAFEKRRRTVYYEPR